MGSFYATIFTTHGALSEPQQSFFQLRDCAGVFAALEFAVLESFEATDDHYKEVLVAHSIYAAFLDGAFLEVDFGEHEVFAIVFFGGLFLRLDDIEGVRCVVLVVRFLKNLGVLGCCLQQYRRSFQRCRAYTDKVRRSRHG